MRNIIFIAIIGLILTSCQNDAEKAAEARKQAIIDSIKMDTRLRVHSALIYGLDRIAESSSKKAELSQFSNPVLIMGSTFGHYFQSLYKLGKYDEMVRFTTLESVAAMGGPEAVKQAYSKLKFAYDMRLKSKSESGDTIILNYEAGIYATKHMIRVPVKIENDTTKLIFEPGIF
jgi:hypothetical protein